MRVEIFLVTYAPDAHWLDWALKSIKRFASGFYGTSVLCPAADERIIGPICKTHGANIILDDRAGPPLGFLDHMVKKCYADHYLPGADFIFHTDSDVMFIEPATPETFFKEGKPIMLVEPYSHLRATNNPAACWLESTSRVLQWLPKYETMRRHGAVYPREIYGKFRAYIEKLYAKPFRTFMLEQTPLPLGWSEFNCLGSFAQRFCPEKFSTIDVSLYPWPAHPLVQFWSRGPINAPVEIWIKGKLCRVVPKDELAKIMPD